MKLKHLLLSLILIGLPGAAVAKFRSVDTVEVPLKRLLTNLSNRLTVSTLKPDEKAKLEFRIGRLHSMAYALRKETVNVRKEPRAEDVPASFGMEPFFGYAFGDYHQFRLVDDTDQKRLAQAQAHLQEAIRHMRAALKLAPKMDEAKLGLAWCLDQSGDKAAALPLYREIFKKTWETEKDKGGLAGSSVASETAGYLLPLLDKTKDAREIADIEDKQQKLKAAFRARTPIVVPLSSDVNVKDLMVPANVRFDLDGTGQASYSEWPGKYAGWLVYDGEGRGKIDSGLKLFGPSTFWMFFDHGYDALASLDDDGNSIIEGAERRGLSIWCDTNGNGISEEGEVQSLEERGIASISCKNALLKNGFLYSQDGVKFDNGTAADSYDWLVYPVR